jgi:hypothetical protein
VTEFGLDLKDPTFKLLISSPSCFFAKNPGSVVLSIELKARGGSGSLKLHLD